MPFAAQSRARVLLIEAGRVTLLRWQRRSLRLFAQYRPGPEDFQKFENLLRVEARVPFIIVLDCIEEDFRLENVAHVTGPDREAMLERKVGFAFRGTQFKTARVVGRETDGRKDDRVLMTALTKPELIDPWLSRILNEKLPVQSITSAAYMMELMAATTGLKTKPHVLVTNIEAGSGMRQTYLQKGQVIFSRLTPIVDLSDEGLSTMLLEQSIQTRKYLERIRQLPYDTRVSVHVLAADGMSLEMPVALAESQLEFSSQTASSVVSSSTLALESMPAGAIAASLVQALRGKGLRNVYAVRAMRRFHFIKRIANYLYVSSGAVLLAAVLMTAPTLIDTVSLWQREAETVAQTQPLLQEYEALRSSFPETPISSSTMQLVVSSFEVMRAQTSNPADLLQWLGNGLLQYPNLQLRTFEWELQGLEPTEEEVALGLIEPENEVERFQDRVVRGRTELVVTVSGEVRGAQSFREAREEVLSLIANLEERPGLVVNALEMPIDVRADSAVATTVGDDSVTEEFIVEIRQEVPAEARP